MSDEAGREPAIVPVEQKVVDFYGDELVAIRDEEGTVWVPIRPLCEALGVSRSGQMERIQRDAVLSEVLKGGRVTRPPEQGGMQEMACLPLKYVRAWLFGINANRVKPEIRDRLIAYQREVIEIIDRAFAAQTAVRATDGDEAQILAMRDLARHQAELSRKQTEMLTQQAELWDRLIAEKRRLDAVQQLAEDHEGMIRDLERSIDAARRELIGVQSEMNRRLTTLSDRIRLLPAPGRETITPEQQATIQELVRDLVAAADARGIRLWQKRGVNNFQAVYAELKTTFRVPSYKELTLAQYPRAVEWLQGEIDRVRVQGDNESQGRS